MLGWEQFSVSKLIAVFLILGTNALGQESRWSRIRYFPLPVFTKEHWKASRSWNNELTMNGDVLTLRKADGTMLSISIRSISRLAYGEEALNFSGSGLNGGAVQIPTPLLLISPLKQKINPSNHHFIDIQEPGLREDILLEADKSNYREILSKLTETTGLPMIISKKEKRWMPKGISIRIRDRKGYLSQPTTATLGVLANDTFYFIANSQWRAIDGKGQLAPEGKLKEPIVLKLFDHTKQVSLYSIRSRSNLFFHENLSERKTGSYFK